MITFSRFLLLIFITCYSSLFTAALVYSIRLALLGKWGILDVSLFFDSLIWSGMSICILVLLAGSFLGDLIVRLFLPIRRMSLREEKIIGPALQNIRRLYKQKYGCELKARILVIDAPHITGLSLGRRTIAVSSGLLKVANEDEITATLAHEAGHLHYRDGFFNLALITACTPTIIMNHALRFWERENALIDGELPSQAQDMMLLTRFLIVVCLLFAFVYFILAWVISFPVIWLVAALEKIVEWPMEYRADRFVCDLGLGAGLVSLFERLEIQDIRNEFGFLHQYTYSHPPMALRIDKIERQFMADGQRA